MFKTVKEIKFVRELRVLVRVDLDVSLRNGKIQDDFRIREVLPTLNFILKRGGKIRIVSHLGRPGGKITPVFSMRPVAKKLGKLLKKRIILVSDPFDDKVFGRLDSSPEILFFENMRFWPGEEKNEENFAKKLAKWGDVYVNESFAVSHRKHASLVAVTKYLPSYGGLRMEKEVLGLSAVFGGNKRPLVAVLGGAKLETKMPLFLRFLKEADGVLLGGALANAFLVLKGLEIGKSPVSGRDLNPQYAEFLKNKKVFLPVDVAASKYFKKGRKYEVKKPDEVDKSEYIMDIGPETARLYADIASRAKVVVWNGPLGYGEIEEFAQGTLDFVKKMIKSRAFKITGGGDTVAFLRKHRLLKRFDFVSIGGGAMLEFLAGKKLPGIEALKK